MGKAEVKEVVVAEKKPPEDQIEFEELYKKYDQDDDSSTETLLELEVTPEQII